MNDDETRDFDFPGDFVNPPAPGHTTARQRAAAPCAHGTPAFIACVYCEARR